jgi:enoyl-CoA hydratase/carnithine racemase
VSDDLLIERDGDVVTWTLNLPDLRNAISDVGIIDAIVDAVTATNNDQSIRAVILTGAGSAFSAGGNVKAMAAGEGLFGGAGHTQRIGYREGIQRIPRAMYSLEVPVIAAVNGPAVGAGCDLAMMCDLRVASSTAFFAESFVKLGIIPGDGGAWFLTRLVGAQRAAELTLTGRTITADEAKALGLLLEVVEPDQLMPAAKALATQMARKPPQALRYAKKLLKLAQRQQLEEHLDVCAAYQALCHKTEDHQEALAAFFEKRQGRFTGK